MAILNPSFRRRRPARPFLWVLMALIAAPWAAGNTPVSREYEIKAAFLFNFSQFVEWPPDAFPSPEAPFVIGVLGEDPFGHVLDEAAHGEQSGGRPLVVRRWSEIAGIDACHILFITRDSGARLESIRAQLKERSVLTVSDMPAAAESGVMIQLVTEKNRIRLKINLDATRAARLTVSSKLLRPATIVSTREVAP